ncbi:MAG: phospholipid carrier-dependent glycosyltransferase [Chloroflexi bacterium]|nr:MAG: phospholipid carrier-dependent glycosyltransferase [Chloroflexota bacterium]
MRQYAIRNTQYAIVFLAFALRLFRLAFQELRGDEAFGYFFSLRTYDDIIATTLSLREPHPVGSYFLQHLWLGWAGHSEFALRFVSVWCGVLAVALLYRLARRLQLSPATASTGAFLLAVSPYAIWHSQDARMYSILLALTLASTWLMVEALQRGRWQVWLLYVGVSWLALHTHYFAIFVLAAQNCFVLGRALLMPRVRFGAVQWVQWQFVLGFFYLPWLFTAGETLTGYGGNGDSPSFWWMAQRSLAVFAAGESIPAGWRTPVALGAGLLLLLGITHLWRTGGSRRRTLFLLLLLWAVPVLATWASSQSRPLFNERYLIAAAPPFYLLLAVALTSAIRNSQFTIHYLRFTIRYFFPLLLGSLLLLSLSNHFTNPAYSKTRGWRELAVSFARFSAGLPPEQVRLAQNLPEPTLWYYYSGPLEHIVLPPQAHDAEGANAAVTQLVAEGVTRVIHPVQAAATWDDAGIAQAALAKEYALAARLSVGVWPVEIYSRVGGYTPLSVAFANGVQLNGAALQPERLIPGALLVVHLLWDGERAQLSGSEKVFLHLLDGSGQIVGQTDVPFVAERGAGEAAAYGILLPDTLPAGPYRAIAGLYDPALPGAPRIATTAGADFVGLGVLEGRME